MTWSWMRVSAAAEAGKMRAVPYDGFWAPMDTLKERTALEDMYRHGESPWALWRSDRTIPHKAMHPIDAVFPA